MQQLPQEIWNQIAQEETLQMSGGNNQNTGKQIEDQSWKNRGNAGLLRSMDEGLPIRVIRGYTHKSEYFPQV